VAYFLPLSIGGELFDLSHLEPFTFKVCSKLAKKDLKVHVTYSNHCFTEKYDFAKHVTGEPIFNAQTDKKCIFCRVRYRLSRNLPELIQSLGDPKRKVRETAAARNWCYSITINSPTGPYHIFFEIRRASDIQKKTQDLNLVVESAYHEDSSYGPPKLNGAISFVLLCGKVYRHERTSTKR
jgi:hypothetical protein